MSAAVSLSMGKLLCTYNLSGDLVKELSPGKVEGRGVVDTLLPSEDGSSFLGRKVVIVWRSKEDNIEHPRSFILSTTMSAISM